MIVAVIDSGIDAARRPETHTLDQSERDSGNGIDDDGNGYIDDIHGWNFLGGKDGRSVKVDSDEGARVYYGLKAKWDNREVDRSKLSKQEAYEYEMFLKAKARMTTDDSKENEALSVDLKA